MTAQCTRLLGDGSEHRRVDDGRERGALGRMHRRALGGMHRRFFGGGFSELVRYPVCRHDLDPTPNNPTFPRAALCVL